MKKEKKYWVIGDTHFGHGQMQKFCGRHEDFSDMILKNIVNVVNNNDVLIHLGDICIGHDSEWHNDLKFIKNAKNIKLWLVKGNHDKKSNSWYLDNGWDFVCDSFTLRYMKKNILFSHKPMIDNGYDLNIHGHFHNSKESTQEPELIEIKNDKQFLFAIENTNYRPLLLKNIITEKLKLK